MTMRGRFLLVVALVLAAGLQAQTDQAWQIGPFARPESGNPVIAPRAESVFTDPVSKKPVNWEALHTFNPAAIVRDGKVFVLYRAEDDSGAMEIGGHTSRLGLAESEDGVHFTRRGEPVFFPARDKQETREWPGGVEDPRIVERDDGPYVLTYTQWNRDRKTYSVGIATSRDLTRWTKHGPAFLTAAGGKYAGLNYKSAGIVTRLDSGKGRLIAAKIDGKYWMYWGEGAIHLATSADLIHWAPVEDAAGAPIELLRPRAGHFDSSFPETGPPPVLTDAGIVVLYNGKNAAEGGDAGMGANAYAAGEALFDSKDPAHLIAQGENPDLKPEMPYERTGQYIAGTTFAEGLVYFHGRWFLYYGCADSLVGVVTAPTTPFAGVEGFYLKNNDTVVFYGDSITEQNYYNQFVELYTATRFPAMRIHFYGAGVGGDRVTGGGGGPIDERLSRDVFALKPTVVTVMLGMNDGGYQPTTEEIESTYTKGYTHLMESIHEHAPGARVTLLGPSPFDDVTRPTWFASGYNGVMEHFAGLDKELAQKFGGRFIDLNPAVVAAIEKAQALDPRVAKLLLPDRVHPEPVAHWVMAEALLRGWNAPALVSRVTIDARGGKATDAENAAVDKVERVNGTLRWTETENALPLALIRDNEMQALLLEVSDIQQQLNQEPLRVTGLDAGQYKLTIDKSAIGTFTAEELAKGINLADYADADAGAVAAGGVAGAGPRRGALHSSAHGGAEVQRGRGGRQAGRDGRVREFAGGLDLRDSRAQGAWVRGEPGGGYALRAGWLALQLRKCRDAELGGGAGDERDDLFRLAAGDGDGIPWRGGIDVQGVVGSHLRWGRRRLRGSVRGGSVGGGGQARAEELDGDDGDVVVLAEEAGGLGDDGGGLAAERAGAVESKEGICFGGGAGLGFGAVQWVLERGWPTSPPNEVRRRPLEEVFLGRRFVQKKSLRGVGGKPCTDLPCHEPRRCGEQHVLQSRGSLGFNANDHESAALRGANQQQQSFFQRLAVENLAEIGDRFHRLPVGLGNHHAGGQSGQVGRAAGANIGNHDAMVGLDAQLFGHLRRQVLHLNPQLLESRRLRLAEFFRAGAAMPALAGRSAQITLIVIRSPSRRIVSGWLLLVLHISTRLCNSRGWKPACRQTRVMMSPGFSPAFAAGVLG